MGSLQNLQIDQSFTGLIKTNDEAAIGLTEKALQDGAGNDLPVEVGTDNVKFTEGLQLERSIPTFKITNTDFNRTTYPLAPSGGTIYIDGEDQNGLSVFELRQDRYGSVYYKNIHADQGETHVFQSILGTGASTPAKIAMDTYNGSNNSDNWGTAYNERITTGSYDSGTSDLTLTKPGGTDIVVNIPAGGGETAPMAIDQLPARANATFSTAESFRTHVATTGYNTASAGTQAEDKGQIAVIPMGEGWEINYIFTAISTAVASAVGRIAIYDLEINSAGELVVGTKLRDVGTFDASTTGYKKLDISTNPFVMPAGKDYGAVAIVFAADTSGVAYTSFGNAVWSGNGGSVNNDTTWYRCSAWNVTATGQNLGTTMPTSLASASYDKNTSNPIFMGVNA